MGLRFSSFSHVLPSPMVGFITENVNLAMLLSLLFWILALWHGYGSDVGELLEGATVNTIPNTNQLGKPLLIVSCIVLTRKSSFCACLLLLAHNCCILVGRHKDVMWKINLVATTSMVLFKGVSLYMYLCIDDMICIQACWQGFKYTRPLYFSGHNVVLPGFYHFLSRNSAIF
jgi:hypothetical protein